MASSNIVIASFLSFAYILFTLAWLNYEQAATNAQHTAACRLITGNNKSPLLRVYFKLIKTQYVLTVVERVIEITCHRWCYHCAFVPDECGGP